MTLAPRHPRPGAPCRLRLSASAGRRPWLAVTALLAVALTVLLTGCHGPRFDDPIAVMLDRDRSVAQRLAASDQLGAIDAAPDADPDAARYRAALDTIAWSNRHPIELRRIALDRLVDADASAFRDEVDRRLTDLDDEPTLRHVLDHVIAHQWQALVPAVVRSYARPSPRYTDADRPERDALAALRADQPPEQTVYDVFIGAAHDPRLNEQAAAWTLLTRLLDRATLVAWLDAAPPATELVRDLHAAAEVLDDLPDTREQVHWLMRLRRLDGGHTWRDVRDAAAQLTDAQRRGLALRHLPLLRDAFESHRPLPLKGQTERTGQSATPVDDIAPLPTRAALVERIADTLAPRRHVTREAGLHRDDWTESFADQHDALPWGDLLAVDLLTRALERPEVVRAMFEQADADHLDDLSEHGGAVVRDADGYMPRAFAPAIRVNPRRYVASDALIEQMHTALAHYHFHAQRHDNRAFAGPGLGDLAFARRFGCHALVLTFIDRDTLNVDYYQPDGIVVDLGNVRRE